MKRVKIGVVGCGNISPIYLTNLTKRFSDIVEVVTVCDRIFERAQNRQTEYHIPNAVASVQELLKNPEIEIVLNITNPASHAEVNLQCLEAGRSVYVEKPLSISREDGKRAVALAKEKGLLLGGAPDTFLGGGLQTCRKLIDEGWIGDPIAATAFMACHGHESWHPDPEFYYEVGGGPVFDMAPYYLTALVQLMGPVKRVAGSARKTFATRTITSQPKYGKIIDVEVPTHVAGILGFESGACGNLMMSFDVWGSQLPFIEVYGSRGSLSVPDPNTFGGPVRLLRPGSKEWETVPIPFGYQENSRGLGVADMAAALRAKRTPRANAGVTYHVLDVMHALHDSSDSGAFVEMGSTCARSDLLPLGLLDGQIEV